MHANEAPKSDPEAWRREAACRDTDPAAWFPAKKDAIGRKRALAICARCPVLADCRDELFTLPAAQQRGIRAGLTEAGMRRARGERRRQAAAS